MTKEKYLQSRSLLDQIYSLEDEVKKLDRIENESPVYFEQIPLLREFIDLSDYRQKVLSKLSELQNQFAEL